MLIKDKIVASILLSALLMLSCKSAVEVTSNKPVSTNTESVKTTATPVKSNVDGTIPSGTGVEKEKPAARSGNVQGRVLYNGQPVKDIEVKLCEKYSQYLSGCGGETFTAKTDSQGEYLIKNVPPKIYEGLIVKVFDSNYYVFATSGIAQAAKYNIEEGKTFFAPDTNLFKQDLKVLNPKAGSKIDGNNIEVKWDTYPEAAYYKFSLFADSSSGATSNYDYINKRVDGSSYTLDTPLSPGIYTVKVEAFNSNDLKLSQNSSDIKFTATGGATK